MFTVMIAQVAELWSSLPTLTGSLAVVLSSPCLPGISHADLLPLLYWCYANSLYSEKNPHQYECEEEHWHYLTFGGRGGRDSC